MNHSGSFAALLALAALLSPSPAHAAATMAVDFDLAAPLHQPSLRYAVGLGARFGWRFDLGPLFLQPELGASLLSFKQAPTEGVTASSSDVPRLLGGARLGLARTGVVQPFLFGHGGLGWAANVARGPTADVGLGLDVALVPHFTFGAQLAYNTLSVSSQPHTVVIMTAVGPVSTTSPALSASLQWISAGIHGGLTF